jgi:ketosteroid isomerase-like protein
MSPSCTRRAIPDLPGKIIPRMKWLLLLALLGLVSPLRADDAADIRGALAAQVAAWNRGDIPGFMETYWKSDELRFASGGTVTRGWRPALERYLKRYPDQAAMGTLAFTDLEVTVLAPDVAIVFGKWELTRAHDKPWGLFTLIWRKIGGAWVIVSDHTSSGEK